ncbi:helix-turn-helix domain-containing protein [Actinomadura parmotrematis]|uniref:Helix-turn-helix transcriptional regulator n=1 Tax=Actinomadura parmotrematis TaxID=2864039 RepID=A0ABS7FRE8_9ACTN|nr:helix-turn-helix transcriptional regulator [Actinomadura parmotrematis]MBW8482969.1 helix-turn-helix transcriptional regulator [Actinomadura parmotrematis]
MRELDPARSLWDLAALEVSRQRYWASLTITAFAELIGCDRSTVSRIESGGLRLSLQIAAAIDETFAARGLFTCLVGHASARREGNWMPGLADYEKRASRIRMWEPTLVPGLMQTPAYGRAVLEAAEKAGLLTDVEGELELRMARQRAVWEREGGAPRMSAVVSWAVLELPVGGPGVMHDQLAHLLALSERPRVSVRVVPKSAGAHTGHDGPHKLLSVGGRDVAFSDGADWGGLVLDLERVERFALRCEQIGDLAAPVDRSREMITRAMESHAELA